MILETLDAFKALKAYGIHTVRSAVVDTPEEAVVFATHTNNKLSPIVLHGRTPAVDEPAPEASATAEAIREAYARIASQRGTGRLLASDVQHGTLIELDATDGGPNGKTLALVSTNHRVEQMLPLGPAGAETLASNTHAHEHHGNSEKFRRMLEHLLLRVSDFYVETGVASARLVVRLHENTYTVTDATIVTGRALHVKERLAAHAHDRSALGFQRS
jgi:hypothetical protein